MRQYRVFVVHRNKRKQTYLELWPIHSHIYTMIIRPPFEIFLVVGVIYRVIKFLVYLWKPGNNNIQFMK